MLDRSGSDAERGRMSSEAELRAAHARLRERSAELRARKPHEVHELLAAVLDRWRDPASPERARLERELTKINGEIAKIDKKLSNPKFLEKAPEEVVEEQRERRADADLSRQKLDQAVARLNAM